MIKELFYKTFLLIASVFIGATFLLENNVTSQPLISFVFMATIIVPWVIIMVVERITK